ncbi:MAG: hypothetical protein ACI8ZB_005087 [Desulforhopalus sp.]|jgi:hypothetical protein
MIQTTMIQTTITHNDDLSSNGNPTDDHDGESGRDRGGFCEGSVAMSEMLINIYMVGNGYGSGDLDQKNDGSCQA